MKKIFIPIVALLLTTALVTTNTSCSSCSGGDDSSVVSDTIDTALLKPAADSMKVARGIVLDGASNSVTIRTTEGDTLEFEYSYLPSEFRYHSEIDDSIEVTYVCRIINNIDIDSVTLIKKIEH
ncbi:MAG: hypothetical protein IJ835_05260 [Muribaculaceae bacterium]|nr:hypothetical protein [Muribaculaceae bacterium]